MLIPIDAAHIQNQLLNDCQQLRTMKAWVNDRYNVYNQNMTTANMTAASIASGDQTAITQLVTDFGRLALFMSGTLPGAASNITTDINNITGIV
jgi:hypothetical protein